MIPVAVPPIVSVRPASLSKAQIVGLRHWIVKFTVMALHGPLAGPQTSAIRCVGNLSSHGWRSHGSLPD
jgi:hypothetical protein